MSEGSRSQTIRVYAEVVYGGRRCTPTAIVAVRPANKAHRSYRAYVVRYLDGQLPATGTVPCGRFNKEVLKHSE